MHSYYLQSPPLSPSRSPKPIPPSNLSLLRREYKTQLFCKSFLFLLCSFCKHSADHRHPALSSGRIIFLQPQWVLLYCSNLVLLSGFPAVPCNVTGLATIVTFDGSSRPVNFHWAALSSKCGTSIVPSVSL